MPLILTLRVGHDFYADDKRVVVSKVHTSMRYELRTHDNRTIQITDDKAVEVYEGVYVQAGIPKDMYGSLVRLVINAKGVKVLRGDIYNLPKSKVCMTCLGKGLLRQKIHTEKTMVQDFPCPDCERG